jgi:hypothetical protein
MPENALTVEEAKKKLDELGIPEKTQQEILADVVLSNDIVTAIHKMIDERAAAGLNAGSWEDFAKLIDDVAVRHGIEGGLPMPNLNGRRLLLAHRAPLAFTNAVNCHTTEMAEELSWRHHVRNSWNVLGDHTVCIVDTEDGPMTVRDWHAGTRLRKLIDDIGLRSDNPVLTADAELRAVESLKSKINPQQFRTYVLSGLFVERSPRSDLHYIFRKGRPTLVVSGHWPDVKTAGTHVIAALCMHPYGYYEFSHVGVLTPTDEVIAALLFLRADEHKFWAKSGQWPASDPRSGI